MPSKPPLRIKRDVLAEQRGQCCLIEWGMCLMPETPLSLVCASEEYATWEHLTPRARGGNGSKANVRLSHKKCNHARDRKPLPGYDENAGKTLVPASEPFGVLDGMALPEPFTSAWLRWKGYL